jgi:hypothetical protein
MSYLDWLELFLNLSLNSRLLDSKFSYILHLSPINYAGNEGDNCLYNCVMHLTIAFFLVQSEVIGFL